MRAIARARVQIFSLIGTLSELIGCEGVYLWTTIADIAAVFRLATRMWLNCRIFWMRAFINYTRRLHCAFYFRFLHRLLLHSWMEYNESPNSCNPELLYILHWCIFAKCHTITISSNTLTIVIIFTWVSPRELFVLLLLYFAVFDDVDKLSERMFHYFYCHKRIDDEGAV